MRTLPFLPVLLGLVCLWFQPARATAGEFPYRGHWSSGRGDTLVITAKTLRFAGGPALPYRDITRATDGKVFELQITARGEVNGFSGKFLSVTCKRDEMTVVDFASHADLFQERDPGGEVMWFRDASEKDDD